MRIFCYVKQTRIYLVIIMIYYVILYIYVCENYHLIKVWLASIANLWRKVTPELSFTRKYECDRFHYVQGIHNQFNVIQYRRCACMHAFTCCACMNIFTYFVCMHMLANHVCMQKIERSVGQLFNVYTFYMLMFSLDLLLSKDYYNSIKIFFSNSCIFSMFLHFFFLRFLTYNLSAFIFFLDGQIKNQASRLILFDSDIKSKETAFGFSLLIRIIVYFSVSNKSSVIKKNTWQQEQVLLLIKQQVKEQLVLYLCFIMLLKRQRQIIVLKISKKQCFHYEFIKSQMCSCSQSSDSRLQRLQYQRYKYLQYLNKRDHFVVLPL
eukprot:TRINITY_DN16994_c0_g1_i1.p1 TRINITY_DN16994_c0_g1~~TRINITY_DN16994_c0_g1_i1.p1  ORF type:complete len:321 (+),score=-18.54 TRINITY_DN16994_c0_g1_i1:245-1207(+)